MYYSKIYSAVPIGLTVHIIEIEVSIENKALPCFNVIGLTDKSIDESKERVRSSIKSIGYDFPMGRVTVNLAPASLNKKGSLFDLPIALAIIDAYCGKRWLLKNSLFIGELSLEGNVRYVKGVFPILLAASENNFKHVFVPTSAAYEASLSEDSSIYIVSRLKDVIEHLDKRCMLSKHINTPKDYDLLHTEEIFEDDFNSIYGQEIAKRALVISAAGGHNLSLSGPPGCGKTRLSKALVSILPPLTLQERLEITKIYSISGLLNTDSGLMLRRPFRSPHYSTSYVGLLGGGAYPIPGEITLAHRGVLFIDEFTEMSRYIMESLRQPLEDGYISISRSLHKCVFPAKFMLVIAYNPCPCGYANDPDFKCKCSFYELERYKRKISGPILDRMDLFVTLNKVSIEDIHAKNTNITSSKELKLKVIQAREVQYSRYKSSNNKQLQCNADLDAKNIFAYIDINPKAQKLIDIAMNKFKFSLRSYFRILKVSRTIADLDNSLQILDNHIAEALQYRLVRDLST